jgi:hypothetical protein
MHDRFRTFLVECAGGEKNLTMSASLLDAHAQSGEKPDAKLTRHNQNKNC